MSGKGPWQQQARPFLNKALQKTVNKNVDSTSSALITPKHEQILVIPRAHIFYNNIAWHGLYRTDFAPYTKIIQQYGEFKPRMLMENDETYKQIIPYLVFLYKDKIFVMERKHTASEQRLASKLSIGIGGHIRQTDQACNNIFAWAQREFHEEVAYCGTFQTTALGIINDDGDSVGRVHLGFVFLLHADSNHITIKDEHKRADLINLHEISDFTRFENWSQLVLQELQNHTSITHDQL